MERLEASVAGIKQELESYKTIVKALTNENIDLRNQNDQLKNRIGNVEIYLENRKQQQICNNIVICGIEQKPDEDMKNIVNTITAHLGIETQPDEICNVYRKPISKSATSSSGLPSPIVVVLRNKSTQEAIIAAKKGKAPT